MDDLSNRALKGLVRLQIALALIIFLPAWSLTYWQGWLYWLLFGAATAVVTLYFLRYDPALVKRRMKVGPGAEQEPTQKRILWLGIAALISLYVVSVLDHRLGWSHVPVWLVLAGDALVVAGYYGMFLTLRENSFAAATVRVEQDQRVVSTGPYALVRHPMYAAGIIMFAGTPPALGSLWGLAPVAMLAAAVIWRLLDEEAYLAHNLSGYADYQRQVRARLIPGVW